MITTLAQPKLKPGYKRTKVGVIPEDWEVKRLEEICSPGGIVRGPFGGSLKKEVFSTTGFKVYEQRNAIYKSCEIGSYYVDRAKYDEMRRFSVAVGDFIISCSGTIGRIYQIPSDGPQGIINQALLKLTTDNDVVHERYFYILFEWDVFQVRVIDSTQGGAMKNLVGMDVFKTTPVSIPPLPEQRAIADALSDVDELMGALGKLIAKKQAIKLAVMQQLLTGKTRLPGFTGELETKRLGALVQIIPSGIYGLDKQTGSLIGMPVATTAHIDINDTWNNKNMEVRYFTENQVAHYSPSAGDLIVVKSSGTAASIQSGKIGFVSGDKDGTFIFSNFLMLLRPTECNAQFLFYHLVSDRVKRMLPHLVEASTYPNIRINDYLEIEILMPHGDEQRAIAVVLSDMDAEIAALERRLDKTKQIKQGMMQQLLTGRIRLI